MSSAFKNNEAWRRNEPPTAAKYFECRLSWLIEQQPGMNVTKMARLLGVSKTSISQWTHGNTMPPSDIQEKIAYLLGCHSRADVWIWRGKHLTERLLKLNKLYQEIEQEEERIETILQSPPLTIQKSAV